PHVFYGLVSSARSTSPRLLVVLPFTNVGSDSANQALCDGLVETLTTKLSLFEQFQNAFRVVPASEVRGEAVSTARKAKEAFGAAFVITGSVQRLGDERIRLGVNLIDTASLVQDSVSIDQRLVDLPVIQDSVVLKVAELLNGRLPHNAAAILDVGQPTIAAANEPYVQGRGRLGRYQNPVDVDAAIELFQRALAIDHGYALAYAAL